jgi:hypothetical protein
VPVLALDDSTSAVFCAVVTAARAEAGPRMFESPIAPARFSSTR